MQSSRDAARELLATALKQAEAAIPTDAAIGEFEPWDSLGHMRIVLEIERRLGRTLSADEIARIDSIADVRDILQTR